MRIVTAEIITIGDEILYGQILDSNSQWLGEQLTQLGVKVKYKLSIGDNKEDILSTLEQGFKRSDIILVTGGLGPTKDDITKKTIADFFNVGFKTSEKVLVHLGELFAKRGREMTELNKGQADIPENGEVMFNRVGTALGMAFLHDNRLMVSMPGVPHEMKTIMEEGVFPRIKELFELPIIKHFVVRTAGIPESLLAKQIETWEEQLPSNIGLAYLPNLGQVRLRMTGVGTDLDAIEQQFAQEYDKLEAIIGGNIFGFGTTELHEAIGQKLAAKGQFIGVAESCTGGYISHLFTKSSGSSQYYKGSVTSYHNSVKESMLGVSDKSLEQHGAVSETVAKEMVEGVRKSLGVDYAIATTGIAGPTGGTEEKPVGLVWIGVASATQTIVKSFTYAKDREMNIRLFTNAALVMMWELLAHEQ